MNWLYPHSLKLNLQPWAENLLGWIGGLIGLLFCSSEFIRGWRTGATTMPKPGSDRDAVRDREPIRFWISMSFHGIISVGLFWSGVMILLGK